MTAVAAPSRAPEEIEKQSIVARITQKRWFEPFAVAAVLTFGFFGIPALFDSFWVANFTQMAVFSIVAASAGLLYGRVGLVSLGQVAAYGIGCWVTIRLSFATTWPFPVLLIIGGVVAAFIGVLIGMPALRVSGLYLALVTLMLAAGMEIVLGVTKFPNGGSGFQGLAGTLSDIKPTRRPSWALTDEGYYRFIVVAAFTMFMLASFVLSRKPGRAWASIRQSEAAALAAGIDVTRYKLWAFALSAFMAGVAGGLYAGTVPKGMSIDAFNRQAAIFLIAVVIMGGIYSLWGGLLGAFFATCLLKFLTQNVVGHQFWTRFALSLFGFGLLMNLIQNTKAAEKKGHRSVIDIENLSVHFGGVISLDQMTIQFPEGTCGLIGPNGAGKTTFFNVLSGFVTPRSGRIEAMGQDLLALPDFKRARWGLRRTFQMEQAIEKLTVFDNVATVYEHADNGGKAGRTAAVDSALEFVGLTEVAHKTVRTLGAKDRRFIEVARAVVGQPKLILLDEPAAGLPDEETAMLGQIIRSIPDRVGATVILVDHDMSLVQACCDWTAVLDFGRLLASGPTGEVLHDPNVMRAYLGTEEVAT